ncbi:hypothetical protein EJ05DRAFT_541380 [Pseudovirgaria hyperparasitica]|uniref:DUF3752 domain-containing protein n=1 Tax=Pseudovirgaria hyperparasitica TaxID=470096 RepID=A0A6A6VUD3_9PEZI|nr:uncharacterized protein EJ05DRAFT_541380 [Pseudovirgaria hyperparasitica]KAF2754298.1 hypothetical protein EJ05DRAFT_541380 [Pseudovirgaria hyperparasitica]
MSSIGPELPPHLLAKRKRQAEEQTTAKAIPKGDARPSPDAGEKRRRIVGPAPPPAPLDELPPRSPEVDDSSSSDDDFGPALPTGDESATDYREDKLPAAEKMQCHTSEKKPQRDEWMMLPPKQDDLAARMDPTKIRARKFNTGKGAKAGDAGGGSSLWTETAEQKQRRLQNEVLGITEPATAGSSDSSRKSKSREEQRARKIKENLDKSRGESLYMQHKERNTVEEDDPSKRAFDREKDMGVGLKLGHAQRKELMNRAADFGSKFSGGGFL